MILRFRTGNLLAKSWLMNGRRTICSEQEILALSPDRKEIAPMQPFGRPAKPFS
jgi:hypothetical protein